ncbi:MAG: DUF3536 domain-containing protein [Microthrixaceae bacterium]|nr:DUF3536 domain-containing protein [Microthrixaceae bacterium]
MTVYLCVHGHAYQPPRENPETGVVDRQPSAEPFHDWNERITDECYRRFGRAEVHGPDGGIATVMNLWGEVSFDLGPTLGVWMDRQTPDVAEMIAGGEATFGGAMAHPWVHAILPLTPFWDRSTIVRWGIDDFEHRFGRQPAGMWLPETAVDVSSLEALVDAGITWTLLAPHQVRRVGDAGTGGSAPGGSAPGGSAPGHRPLVVELPSGRSITVVPYDGGLSHGIAFNGLLNDGVALAEAFLEAADRANDGDLIVAATDLETFGHHHAFGEMALAKAVEVWVETDGVELISPERYLALAAQQGEPFERGELVAFTSWSCAHGVERWRSNCGCRFEEVEGQDQSWRAPLRDALDTVAEVTRRILVQEAGAEFHDVWAARNAYGRVLAAGSSDAERDRRVQEFLAAHLVPRADAGRAIGWMEAERLRLEAWSSCAWFFDSLDRIETQQVIDEAEVALEHYSELSGRPLNGLALADLVAS